MTTSQPSIPLGPTQRRLIKRTIMVFIPLGMLIISILAWPLQRALTDKQNEVFYYQVHDRAVHVEQVLNHYLDVAKQVASRSFARKQLVLYNQHSITQAQLIEKVQPILQDAANSATDIVGITRLDHTGSVALAIGEPLPDAPAFALDTSKRGTNILSPYTVNGDMRLPILATIYDRTGKAVGSDIVAFSIEKLQAIILNTNSINDTALLALVHHNNTQYTPLFDLPNVLSEQHLDQVIESTHPESTAYTQPLLPDQLVSAQSILNDQWHLIGLMPREHAYQLVNQLVERLTLFASGLLILGLVGFLYVIHPLMKELAQALYAKDQAIEALDAQQTLLKQAQEQLIGARSNNAIHLNENHQSNQS